MNNEELFNDSDFEKELSVGESFSFDKNELRRVRVEMKWHQNAKFSEKFDCDLDLDVAAILLHDDGIWHSKADVVFYNSMSRWLPDDPDGDVTQGKFTPYEGSGFKNRIKWKDETIPVSPDFSVFGSPDNRGSEEETDSDGWCDEVMHVLLEEVEDKYKEIVFCVVLAPENLRKGVRFSDVEKPSVSIYDEDTDKPLCTYALNKNFANDDAVIVGKLICDKEGNWSFKAEADSYVGGLKTLTNDVYH